LTSSVKFSKKHTFFDGSGSPSLTGAFTLMLPDFNHCCRDIVLWEKPFFSRYLWQVAQWVDSRLGMQTLYAHFFSFDHLSMITNYFWLDVIDLICVLLQSRFCVFILSKFTSTPNKYGSLLYIISFLQFW
jgi:hypothetical protein